MAPSVSFSVAAAAIVAILCLSGMAEARSNLIQEYLADVKSTRQTRQSVLALPATPTAPTYGIYPGGVFYGGGYGSPVPSGAYAPSPQSGSYSNAPGPVDATPGTPVPASIQTAGSRASGSTGFKPSVAVMTITALALPLLQFVL